MMMILQKEPTIIKQHHHYRHDKYSMRLMWEGLNMDHDLCHEDPRTKYTFFKGRPPI